MKSLQFTFTAGELAPEVHGNVGLDAHRAGLALCRNFTIKPHGPAVRRPGFYFRAVCLNSALPGRLIPFVGTSGGSASSATDYDTAVLVELGHQYARFLVNGDLVLEDVALTTITTISGGNTFNGTIPGGWADGDWVKLTGTAQAGLTPLLDQYYELDNVVTGIGGSFTLRHTPVNLPLSATGAPGSPTLLQAGKVYKITSPFAGVDLAAMRVTQSPDYLTLAHKLYGTRELYRTGLKTWAFRTVSFATTQAAPTGVAVTPTPGGPPAGSINHSYVVTAMNTDRVTESLASSVVTAANILTTAGNLNTVTWSAATGAAFYNIYKNIGGIYGLIGRTGGLSFVDTNLLVDTAVTPPEAVLSLNGSAGNYPQAVTYFEQRRVFAATLAEPDRVWATRNGAPSNLTSSTPMRADDALSFKVASQQRNAIQHLVPLNDILALTRGGMHRIFATGGEALSFDTAKVKPQGNAGASDVSPVVTPTSVLYVQAQGSRVREVEYTPEGTGAYRSTDVMLLAPHLVQDYEIADLAYTYAPDQVVWAPRTDGKMLGMTHVPEHKVYAWHQHDTQGSFEDVAVLPENGRDVLYALVTRETGGAGGQVVRYIERLTPQVWSSPLALADAFFVDAGITETGAASSTVDRLWHLEGLTVSALADGAVIPDVLVQGGRITLDAPAAKKHVGLGYVSQMQTLPWFNSKVEAGGFGTTKNISQVSLLVKDTSLCRVGQTFDDMFYAPDRTVSLPFDTPPPLITGTIDIPVGLGWSDGGQVCVEQSLPLPCTVLSVIPDAETGG